MASLSFCLQSAYIAGQVSLSLSVSTSPVMQYSAVTCNLTKVVSTSTSPMHFSFLGTTWQTLNQGYSMTPLSLPPVSSKKGGSKD